MSGWRDRALCARRDAELWFPGYNQRAKAAAAKRVCSACPVRDECLAFAIVARPQEGIWAGLNQRELQAVIAERGRPRPCFGCGTVFVPADPALSTAYCCEEHRAAGRREKQAASDQRRRVGRRVA